MHSNKKPEASITQQKSLYEQETLNIGQSQDSTIREIYTPPMIIQLGPTNIQGGEVHPILEASSGVLTS